MYQRDVKRITEYASKSPDHLVYVGAFVLSTIQTPLVRTMEQVYSIKAMDKHSPALWGFKKAGYQYLVDNQQEFYDMLMDNPDGRKGLTKKLRRLMQTPGLGVVKAGFLMQCVGWDISCLDSHNLRRFKIDPKITKASANSAKVYEYVRFTQRKGAEFWWDDWCEYVANKGGHNSELNTADKVSAYHYQAISGDTQ